MALGCGKRCPGRGKVGDSQKTSRLPLLQSDLCSVFWSPEQLPGWEVNVGKAQGKGRGIRCVSPRWLCHGNALPRKLLQLQPCEGLCPELLGPVWTRCTASSTPQLPACSPLDFPSDPCTCLVTICSALRSTVWLPSFPKGDLLSV